LEVRGRVGRGRRFEREGEPSGKKVRESERRE
jgi:hypothetical protein